MVPVLAIVLVALVCPVYGQFNAPCTSSMISTFTPCINFITNSSVNGTAPTADCCSSLKSLTTNGMDCMCLIVTGSVPFQMPVNRTLAISLPRACNMPSIPVQCKAIGAPIPAPGPVALGPTPSIVSPSASPEASVSREPTPSTLPPESSTTPVLTPPSPSVSAGTPTPTNGSRPVLTPSSAMPSYSFSPSLLLFALGILVFKF